MKMIQKCVLISLIITTGLTMHGASFFNSATKQFLPSENLSTAIPSIFEEKKIRLTELEKELQAIRTQETNNTQATNTCITQLKDLLIGIQRALKVEPDDEFLNKELAIVHDHQQVCKNISQTHEGIKTLIDEHISLLRTYLNDPEAKEYRKELKVEAGKTAYSFEELRTMKQLIQEKDKELTSLKAQEQDLQTEIESLKQTTKSLELSSKKKADDATLKSPSALVTPQQNATLSALEDQLAADKYTLIKLHLKEIEHKKDVIKMRLFLAQEHYKILDQMYEESKKLLDIKKEDIKIVKEDLNKKRQAIVAAKDDLTQNLDSVSREYKAQEEKLETLRRQYNISPAADIEDLSREIKPTILGYTSFLEVAQAQSAFKALQLKKELLEASLALEDKKLLFETINSDSKQSMFKVLNEKFLTGSSLQEEIKHYTTVELKADSLNFAAKKRAAQEALERQKKALDNLNSIGQSLQEQKMDAFKGNAQAYTRCRELLNATNTEIEQQIQSITNLIGVYADITNLVENTTKQATFIINVLREGKKLRRSDEAITLNGIKNIGGDIKEFFKTLRLHIATVNANGLVATLWLNLKSNPWQPVFLLILFALALLGLLIVRKLLPFIAASFIKIGDEYGALRSLSLFCATAITFAWQYFTMIIAWLGTWLFLHINSGPQNPFFMLFYLISIPYLIYLAQRFLEYLMHANKAHSYAFFEESAEQEIYLILSILSYSTISLFFFRQAFILAGFYKSELPRILLASNFIILQLSLIFLITKELVNIIPSKGTFWQWLRRYVDRFYYVILTAIIATIVMINPYVGYGDFVLYGFLRTLLTMALLLVLFWVHTIFRRLAATFFFHTQEETVSDRFSAARTWYSLFAVGLFLLFVLIGTVLIAKIWDWPSTLANIKTWAGVRQILEIPIMFGETATPFSLFSLIKIISFLMIGFTVAFSINHFVFGRVFDVLMVDSGAQNAISSVTRYVVIMVALIIGFQSVGLGALMWTLIATLAVGVSWIMKDMLGDFLAYFIILIQRPIKIGDYIKIDNDTFGVVRRITPRAVILRKRDALTLIVPNMMVISKPLINWNYKPGFIVMDDIQLVIPFKEDPAKIRAILLQTIESTPQVLKNPKPVVRLESFGEYGYTFIVRGFLSSNYTMDQWDIAAAIRLELVSALRKNSITIAMPTRVIVQDKAEDKK